MDPAVQYPQFQVDLPPFEYAAIRSYITGHGFGNLDNCAEFCPKEHTWTVQDTPFTQEIWRADCQSTGVPGQQGTWTYPRAGWCPGADVRAWWFDVSTAATEGTNTLAWSVEAYENTCRPDAPTCAGCTAGATCDDGHGQPYYVVSGVLVTLD